MHFKLFDNQQHTMPRNGARAGDDPPISKEVNNAREI
jgi:hypothetical protein